MKLNGGVRIACLVTIISALLAVSLDAQQSVQGMPVVGYADRLSVEQGQTVRFMVSSEFARYRADIVRLIHGDTNPNGPGFKETVIDTPINGDYPGRYQSFPNGSYAIVPDNDALRLSESFTIQTWIYATTPQKELFQSIPTDSWQGIERQKGVQGIITKYSNTDRLGYGLFLDEDGSVALWIGDGDRVEKVRTGTPLISYPRAQRGSRPRGLPRRSTSWVFVAATFDATNGKVTLVQEPLTPWPNDPFRSVVESTVEVRSVGQSDVPLLIAGYWISNEDGDGKVGGFYNGKVDSPRIFNRVLNRDEIDALKEGTAPRDPVAAWDFSVEIGSQRITDRGPHGLNGELINRPARAVTGRNWTGATMNFALAPEEYGAIHFHDDDLDDAKWEVGFEFEVPPDLRSGVYAARLRAGNGEDYVPFFVRPRKGTSTSKIALLVPTFSYLAYANSALGTPELLSLYNHHSDGSGVMYSTGLRPILNMRPKIVTRNQWQFNADMHLVDWLEAKGFQPDVITDHDLHTEALALLNPYNVVITGTHPEYYSVEMLDAVQEYLEQGGRLMYMGGNGFYWVTSLDPERGHTAEVRRWGGTQAWEGRSGQHYHATTGEMGGLWRFRGRPPQALVGVGFTAQGFDKNSPYYRKTGSFDPRVAFIFDGIGPNELIGNFPSLVLGTGAAGSELDRFDLALGSSPNGLVLASSRPADHSSAYQHVVEEIWSSNSGPWNEGVTRADMVYIEYPNDGAVWTSASIAWCGSLSYNDYNNNVSRITENVLRNFASDASLPKASELSGE